MACHRRIADLDLPPVDFALAAWLITLLKNAADRRNDSALSRASADL
jgi:hypothetical protein